jgi:hypothetical protein
VSAQALIDDVDPAKLRSIARKLNAHLARDRKLTRNEKRNAAVFRADKRSRRDQWLGCGRSAKEFAQLWDSEEMAWRRTIGEGWSRAEKLAWERDHPGQEWPEHECGLNDTEYARYHRWRKRWTRSREHADLYANPRKLLALAGALPRIPYPP